MVYREVIFCLMFGALGFLMAFFLFRTINIGLILLLAWVPFKIFEKFGLNPDWKLLHRAYNLLLALGQSLVDLINSLFKLASTWGLVLFLLGGITGIIMHRRIRVRS